MLIVAGQHSSLSDGLLSQWRSMSSRLVKLRLVSLVTVWLMLVNIKLVSLRTVTFIVTKLTINI